MISIKSFVFNAFMENTYIVYDETKEALVVDPGCVDPNEEMQLRNFIEYNDLNVTKLINTHCHIDHVLGNHFVKTSFAVPFLMHKIEVDVLRSVIAYAPAYGFPGYQPVEPDNFLEEGDLVQFGNSELEVIFVPGHSPGHIALINQREKICISGDVLFNQSIGRTDLPGGDFDTLLKSIREGLFTLPDETVVYSGHGPTTLIKDEKISNPFCGTKSTFSGHPG